MNATVCSSGFCSFESVSRATATIGNASIANWFQMPVTASASVTGRPVNPQPRSIPYDTPMPTAAPPGSTKVDAVEACVSTNACRNRSPGSDACHGGAYVARLSAVAPTSRPTCPHDSVLTTPQTSR